MQKQINTLNTIEAFEQDIYLQLDLVDKIKLQKPLAESLQKTAIFCGSGDSLASAMLAESFSDYTVKAVDPLDLIKNKKILQGKKAYFVSISGNTVSNIKAARISKDSVAITRNHTSRLAKACKKVITLYYEDSKVLTSGSIGFVTSMLTCVSLVQRFGMKNAKNLFSAAKAQSKILLKNKVYIIGNQHTYPVAMYAAAKLYEVLGMDAHYERIEQFSHMGIFSARRGDTVIIFEGKNQHNKHLASQLKKLGLDVHVPSIHSKNKIEQVLFYTFVSQFLALYNAKKKHLSDCSFITNKKIRNASSSMIY
ncbi:MAG: SIS domain-containing protein [Nitrososphaerota archaeon]